MSTNPGLLLFAHGARDPDWSTPFEQVARGVRLQRPGVPVALAFLEFMAPDVVTAGDALASAGCTSVAVVPLFLGAGGHVRKDLPVLVDRLRTAHPHVCWTLTPAVGELPTVISAMATTAVDFLDSASKATL